MRLCDWAVNAKWPTARTVLLVKKNQQAAIGFSGIATKKLVVDFYGSWSGSEEEKSRNRVYPSERCDSGKNEIDERQESESQGFHGS